MAKISINTKNHFRSISLPSTCHPITSQFDEHLIGLISSENTTTSCSSISQSLSTLVGLYDCVDELLLQPANQKVISRNSQSKWVDVVLEGSLMLLDVCGVARDTLLSMKEGLQDVQSLLRRSSSESTIRKEVFEYIDCRKKVKKGIRHCLKNIKKNDRVDRHYYSVSFDSIFRNVEATTVDVFKSLLGYIAGVKTSLIVRLVNQFSDIDKEVSGNEFDDIDSQLRNLISRKKSSIDTIQVGTLRSRMGFLDSEIEELVEELERSFRHLVKTRVTLLNLISN